MDTQLASNPMANKSTLLVVGTLLILILFVAAAWWLFKPSYVPLHKDANESSQAEILAVLGQWQLPYRINASEGLIEVPTESAAAARMHLAEAGIPTRSGTGFELFDQADYGMSEFSQRINYQRAIEGELSRSIMSISEVSFARVHVTFRKAGLYQQAEEQAKASVIVRLRGNASLSNQRVRGIQQLVASAVEGMQHDRVVVLNEDGQLLSQSDAASTAPEFLQIASDIEQDLQNKAEQLLQLPMGANAAKVSVRVQMNFDRVRSVRETPLGGGRESLRHSRETSSSETVAGSNEDTRSQNTRESEYVVGSERAEIEYAAGKIERISVGVVLTQVMGEQELTEIRNLLEAALGLDAQRGDQLVLAYIPESAQILAEPISPVSLFEQPTQAGQPVTSVTASTPMMQSLLQLPVHWIIASVVSIALLILFVVLLIRQGRRRTEPQTPRLSLAERDQLLLEVRRWIADGQ